MDPVFCIPSPALANKVCLELEKKKKATSTRSQVGVVYMPNYCYKSHRCVCVGGQGGGWNAKR